MIADRLGADRGEAEIIIGFVEGRTPHVDRGQSRQRKVGGGRKTTLLLAEDRLLFILVHMKTYPLQKIMAELFDLGVSNVNE